MMRKYFFFILHFFLLTNLTVFAETPDTVSYSLSSPYHSVYTHLWNLQENNFHPEISAKAFIQKDISIEAAQEVAIKLKQILDGEGIFIELDEIPSEPNYIDSTSNKNRYYLTAKYPSIFLIKVEDQWLYSKASIKQIEEIHKKVFPLGTDKLLNLLPKLGKSKYLGLHSWQIIGIFIITFLSFIVYLLSTILFERILIALLYRLGYRQIAHGLIKPIAKPISYLVIFPILLVLIPVIQLPAYFTRYLIIGLNALLPIFLTIIFYRLVDILGAYMVKVAEKTENTLDDQLVPLVRKILKTFVVITGSLFVLINLNISIIPFITGISIGGLAFALAAQDTIKNFFGSLMIFIDKPFQVGNWITSGEIDGEVEEVGLRSTRIRTFRNSLIYVPNGMLADRTIDNHGLRTYRRYYATLALTYDTPPKLIRIFIEGLNKIVEEHEHTRKDKYHIFLNDFGDSSLKIMFYIFFIAPSWAQELEYRHQVILSILDLADKLNVRFAFPTQTLHMETFPGERGFTPEYPETEDEMRKKSNDYFKSKKKV